MLIILKVKSASSDRLFLSLESLGGIRNPARAPPATRGGAATQGVSRLSTSVVGVIWERLDLAPRLQDTFELSADPQCVDEVADVGGPCHGPPEKAVAPT
ncbi:hypothetical protein [Streptomyces sp. NBC_00316]|uniref:hypothetical protein n=1 Tax=Streptomyces sp. NBC_00316 TaxID=2975710 RepID=UPI002E2E8550|nr:hypothetical protein [Streptomyces sp. NBC_00316]